VLLLSASCAAGGHAVAQQSRCHTHDALFHKAPKPIVVKGYSHCCNGNYRAYMRIPDVTTVAMQLHSINSNLSTITVSRAIIKFDASGMIICPLQQL